MARQSNEGKVLNALFYGGLQRATVVLFGMATTMLLAHRAITPHQMGVWSLFLIIAAFVEIVRHGLVKNSVIKYLNTCLQAERGQVLSASLVLNVFITVAVAVVIMLLTPWLVVLLKAPELRVMLYWNNLALLALIPFSHFEWLMLSSLNLKHLFWAYVVRQSVTLLLPLCLMVLGEEVTLPALVIFYAAGIFSGAVAGWWFNPHAHTIHRTSRIWLSRLFHFGKYAFGTNLSSLVFRSTDSFFVSHLLSLTVVAQQSIALRIFNMVDIPSQLIGDILFPKSAHLTPDDRSHIKFYFEKSTGAVLAVVLPLSVIVFAGAELMITLLAGTEYVAAAPYLRWMMVSSIVYCFLKQYGSITVGIGKPRTNFFITTGMAALNIGLCFFMVPRFGLLGAAYAFLTTSIITFFFTQHQLYKQYNISIGNSFRYAVGFYPQMGRLVQQKLSWHA